MSTITKLTFQKKYENFINGKWTKPIGNKYFPNCSPIDKSFMTYIPRSQAEDVELAIAAARSAFQTWKNTSVVDRSNILLKIANRIEENLEHLANVETCDNGKPIRETINADLPLAIDHFRYFAGVIRSENGKIADLDEHTVSQEVHEPLGVIGQIIPWNFPILMAAWKIAPALAAGNTVVLKPAEQTPTSILEVMKVIEDIVPPGVINIVNGFGIEAGKALSNSNDIDKIAFTGSSEVGKLIIQAAAKNMKPVTLELGGKSPNIFCESIFDKDDDFTKKAIEGFLMFAFNQGEVCTCPSRALVHESIYDKFMERVVKYTKKIKFGDPYDSNTMIGAQVSKEQYDKILEYIDIGKKEGAKVLVGGEEYKQDFDGFYIQPTIFEGNNSMRVFQEEIFGPIICVTSFKDEQDAISIANDTKYGLGAGIWSRNMHEIQNISRKVEAGRIWVNCYHAYPAHASFGGYKESGLGRETHKDMLNNYRHTKNIITNYSYNTTGLYL